MPSGFAEFIDTNVLVYEWDYGAPRKQEIAQVLVKRAQGNGVVSSQVAQEFAWTASKKLGLTTGEVAEILRGYQVFKFIPVEIPLVERALETAKSNVISFWDGLIVEAAVAGGCKVLLTEDLNHGQEIRGVRIVNPFLT